MEKYGEEVALLVAQGGPLNGQRWSLQDSLLIGRDNSCDIIVPDRQVSRHHARVSYTPNGVLVEDLGSKNGTHLNGKLIPQPSLLQDGDVLQIALAQLLVFLSSDATLPLQPDQAELHPEMVISPPVVQPDHQPAASTRLRLDKRSRRVWVRQSGTRARSAQTNEIEIDPPLSASQFRLLEILYDQQGKVVSRPELIAGVWGLEEAIGVTEQALDAMVRRLRDRLASVDPAHNYIITVRGHGLRLDNP